MPSNSTFPVQSPTCACAVGSQYLCGTERTERAACVAIAAAAAAAADAGTWRHHAALVHSKRSKVK